MIAMGMGDDDVRHRLAAHRVEQRRTMRLVDRTGINDGDLPLPYDVAYRALEREWSGIVAQYPPHARHHLFDGVRREVELFVVGNILVHRTSRWPLGFGQSTDFAAPSVERLTPLSRRRTSPPLPTSRFLRR